MDCLAVGCCGKESQPASGVLASVSTSGKSSTGSINIIIQNLFCRNNFPNCRVLPHLLLTGLALLDHLFLVGD